MNNWKTHSLLRIQRPWWLPILSVSITLFGVLVLHWGLFPIIFFFWWEVILMVGAALIRSFFSLEGGGFWHNIGQRLVLLAGGSLLGGTFILFAIVFSLKAVDTTDMSGFGDIGIQANLMTIGAIAGLTLHFFGNGRFRTAQPFGELMLTFANLLVVLAILQVFTMHLIPKYPQLEQARWIAIAVVGVKFVVDLLFLKIGSFVQKHSVET